ncbi:hypothetical protein NEDG_01234 [Nematocida displodere]|uniref:Uncharacterized protein n=1 Tax=Nematocida displodere TaxID=1805483 RepID=A0A177EAY7_9MICR|nr:hypothetical protein NEDG_01234 [Nematocida displodere]
MQRHAFWLLLTALTTILATQMHETILSINEQTSEICQVLKEALGASFAELVRTHCCCLEKHSPVSNPSPSPNQSPSPNPKHKDSLLGIEEVVMIQRHISNVGTVPSASTSSRPSTLNTELIRQHAAAIYNELKGYILALLEHKARVCFLPGAIELANGSFEAYNPSLWRCLLCKGCLGSEPG